MSGGAAAALTGLLFVAMSLHARRIMSNLFYKSRAIGTLSSLTSQLLIAAAVLVPGQPTMAIGAEVEVVALYFLFMTVRALTSRGPSTGAVEMGSLRRTAEITGAILWVVIFVGSGLSLITGFGASFYLLAIVMVGAFGWNIYVA